MGVLFLALRPKPIRHMVAQKENKVDFEDIMQNGKIFLAKLSQGAIGTENSYLLGAFLVTKLNQIAFSRQNLPESKRRNFYAYIDEFHNFVTPSMESILSGARKYKMGLVLAHQEMRQLESRDQDVASSVLSNPYTRVCFRLGDHDAKKLQNGFSFFESKDLQSLGIGEAIARIERSEYDFNLHTPPLPEIDPEQAEERRQEIIRYSREKYGTPKAEVEDLIYESVGVVRQEKSEVQVTEEPVLKTDSKPTSGRGGLAHKAIQRSLQQVAHEAGFSASIEEHIGDGALVDLVITTAKEKIACEISVSTAVAHELGNLEKCIDAGFNSIILVSDDTSHIAKMSRAVRERNFDGILISVFTSEEAEKYIRSLIVPDEKSTIVRGRTVKTQWCDVSDEGKERREIVVAKVVGINKS